MIRSSTHFLFAVCRSIRQSSTVLSRSGWDGCGDGCHSSQLKNSRSRLPYSSVVFKHLCTYSPKLLLHLVDHSTNPVPVFSNLTKLKLLDVFIKVWPLIAFPLGFLFLFFLFFLRMGSVYLSKPAASLWLWPSPLELRIIFQGPDCKVPVFRERWWRFTSRCGSLSETEGP